MQQYLTSTDGLYALVMILLVAMVLLGKKIHNAIKALQTVVDTHLPAPVAAVVDAALEQIDSVAQHPTQQNLNDMVSVLDKFVHYSVQNANALQVNDAKQAGLFSGSVAAAVKDSVRRQVLDNLGPLKDALQAHVGDLASIVAQMIEAKVTELKKV